MSEDFDPYYMWLGIPPQDQPASNYRLLGVQELEENLDVIEQAADRQMSHLQTHKSGTHSDLSQKLLNEISAAKICLLNTEKKAAYDDELKLQQTPAAESIPQPVALQATPVQTAPTWNAPSQPIQTPQQSTGWNSFTPLEEPVQIGKADQKPPWMIPAIAGGSALVGLILLVIFMFSGNGQSVAETNPNNAATDNNVTAPPSNIISPAPPPVVPLPETPKQPVEEKPPQTPPPVVDNPPAKHGSSFTKPEQRRFFFSCGR